MSKNFPVTVKNESIPLRKLIVIVAQTAYASIITSLFSWTDKRLLVVPDQKVVVQSLVSQHVNGEEGRWKGEGRGGRGGGVNQMRFVCFVSWLINVPSACIVYLIDVSARTLVRSGMMR